MKAPLLLFVAALLCACSPASASNLRKLGNFTLSDQHGTARTYRFPKQKVTLMTLADWRGSEQLEPWIQRVYDRYGKRIDIDGVADLSMVPKPLRGMVQRAFAGKLTYSVMLDWEGPTVRQFPTKAGVANIYVIDRAGRIVAHHTGPANDAAAAELFSTIDRTISAD